MDLDKEKLRGFAIARQKRALCKENSQNGKR